MTTDSVNPNASVDDAKSGDLSEPDSFVACITMPNCIDLYLWSVYQRTPKIDVAGNFAWKDSDAAGKASMSPKEYVIGGMDPSFRVTLYRALRTLDAAGFKPGIMCGFRDDYRQSITTGKIKARKDRSYHGGSARGGHGHGVAADIVSIEGESRRMWNWIDRHEKQLGVGRPYLSRDPSHVAPVDGEEYATHRSALKRPRAGSKPRSKRAAKAHWNGKSQRAT
jgi:hypothetical protein